jgi:hypothetical protein
VAADLGNEPITSCPILLWAVGVPEWDLGDLLVSLGLSRSSLEVVEYHKAFVILASSHDGRARTALYRAFVAAEPLASHPPNRALISRPDVTTQGASAVGKIESSAGEGRHRTKKGSESKERTVQTIGRAHAINGFVADRRLMRAATADAALAGKEDQRHHAPPDYRGHYSPPEWGPCGSPASISTPKGPAE